MAVSREDREAYERGRANFEQNPVELVFDCLSLGRAADYGYTGSQLEAYQKGLSGEQLDK